MLNYKDIAKVVETPSEVKVENIEQFKQLTEVFPYASIFYQLLLKSIALHDVFRFETELNNYAYCVPDRVQLYKLVHDVSVAIQEQSIEVTEDESIENYKALKSESEQVVDEDKIIEDILESKEEVINNVVSSTEDIKVNKEEEKSSEIERDNWGEEGENVDELEKEIEENISQTLKEEEDSIAQDEIGGNEGDEQIEENVGEINVNELDELEKEILAHAVSSSISLEVDEENEDGYDFEKIRLLDKAEIQEGVSDLDFEVEDEEEKVEEENRREDDNEILEEQPTKQSFTSWLRRNKGLSDNWESTVQNVTSNTESSTEVKKSIKNIVVKRRAAEFYSPSKKAKKSLDSTELPVSETLSKIYEAQGNFPKAIEAYEKLMLIIPEKKTFFAIRIETLKKKINN